MDEQEKRYYLLIEQLEALKKYEKEQKEKMAKKVLSKAFAPSAARPSKSTWYKSVDDLLTSV